MYMIEFDMVIDGSWWVWYGEAGKAGSILHIGGSRKKGENINFHLDYTAAYHEPMGFAGTSLNQGRNDHPAYFTLQFVDGNWDEVHELARWSGSQRYKKHHVKVEGVGGTVTCYVDGLRRNLDEKTQHKQLNDAPVYVSEPGQTAAIGVTVSNLKIGKPGEKIDDASSTRAADYEWSCDGADAEQCKR